MKVAMVAMLRVSIRAHIIALMLEKSGGIMRLTRSLIWAGASHTQGQMILMDAKDQLTANAMMAKIPRRTQRRSEEHTSELQSLMRNTYAVFCLNKKKN